MLACAAMTMSATDTQMMQLALRQGRFGLGRTADNPSVGAVIWELGTGHIVGVARTADGGRPHAETLALSMARETLGLSEGATLPDCAMAVSLEPCSHHGKTPPCADSILDAGLQQVVVGVIDLDGRVAGGGLAKLQDAGVEVVTGVMADVASWDMAGHLLRSAVGRPFCQAKIATDAAGQIAAGDGEPVWVTGELARQHGHLLRAQADAILVGSGTVRSDNPSLTCRLPGLEAQSPVRVVIDRSLQLDLGHKIFVTAGDVPTCVVYERGDASRHAALGVDVIKMETVSPLAVLEALAKRGITRVLIEGGPKLVEHFLKDDCVDEMCWYQSTETLAKGVSCTVFDSSRVHDEMVWAAEGVIPLGPDQLKRYRFRKTIAQFNG